jgi:hypothetical protein
MVSAFRKGAYNRAPEFIRQNGALALTTIVSRSTDACRCWEFDVSLVMVVPATTTTMAIPSYQMTFSS